MERKILLDLCRVFRDCAKIGQVKERAVLEGSALSIFGRDCMVQTVTLYLAGVAGVKRGFGRARARGRAREKERKFPSSLLPRAWSRALIPFHFLSSACHAGYLIPYDQNICMLLYLLVIHAFVWAWI